MTNALGSFQLATNVPGVTIRYSSKSRRSNSFNDDEKAQPPSDYDYTLPTCVTYHAEGNRVFVGQFAKFRSRLDVSYHANYTLERQKLQDVIIQDSIGSGTIHEHPWIIFSAGAMGAGKGHCIEWMSTQGHFPLPDIVHVDPDRFRTELPEWDGYLKHDALQAGRMTHRESGCCVEIAQEAAMEQRKNVWVDGSLRDAEWYEGIFKDIRNRFPHYRIAIIHVLAPWEVICSRAASRAKETGRFVPEAELLHSFQQVPSSVERLCPLADFTAHIENNDLPRLTTSCIGATCWENVLGDWHEIHARFAALPELACDGDGKVQTLMQNLIAAHSIVIFSKSYCSYCKRALRILSEESQSSDIHVVQLDTMTLEGSVCKDVGVSGAAGVVMALELARMTGQRTVPQVYIHGAHIGGCDNVQELQRTGKLTQMFGVNIMIDKGES